MDERSPSRGPVPLSPSPEPGPAPTVAGEDPREFEQIIAVLRADYANLGEGGILHQWHLEVAAWKMFTVRRGMRAQRGAWDAAIADSLQRRPKWCANTQISPPIRHSL